MPQQVKRLMHRPNAGIRTEITRSITHHLPCYCHFGEWIIEVNLDVRITFVILQPDVKTRPMFLDQVHFKDQRFKFRTDHDPLQVGDLADHFDHLALVIRVLLEV